MTKRGYTAILVRLVDAAPLTVRVFDIAGHLVRTLFTGEQGGGSFSAQWDGTNAARQQMPPGIYLFRVDLATDAKEEAVRGHRRDGLLADAWV